MVPAVSLSLALRFLQCLKAVVSLSFPLQLGVCSLGTRRGVLAEFQQWPLFPAPRQHQEGSFLRTRTDLPCVHLVRLLEEHFALGCWRISVCGP